MAAFISEQEQALAIALDIGVPTILWGEPGIGKTSTVYQLAELLGYPIETVIAALREPSDFGGLPMLSRNIPKFNKTVITKFLATKYGLTAEEVDENLSFLISMLGTPSVNSGLVSFAPPAWALRLKQAGKGILFLDELSTARPAVQTSVLRVVLERVVGDLRLPPEVRVLAAANGTDQIAGGWDLSSPLANRFCHLDWGITSDTWCNGFLYGWPKPNLNRVPANWQEKIPLAKQHITAFIQSRPEFLHQRPTTEVAAGRAWPSPRTWEMASRLYAACLSMDTEKELTSRLVRGSIGAPAIEFFNYLDALDLPNPEDLLLDPKDKLPARDDQLYAALGSVVYAVIEKPSEERWHKAWQVLSYATKVRSADIAVAHAYALAAARPKRADGSPARVPGNLVADLTKMLAKAGIFNSPDKGDKHA